MTSFSQIVLVARQLIDIDEDRSDYLVYAHDRLVGRIYRQLENMSGVEQWFWGIQGVFTNMEIGQLHGLAGSFDEAKIRLRTAFELWLTWAFATSPSHLSYSRMQQDLRDVGAHELAGRLH